MSRLEDYLSVYFITDSEFGRTHEEIAEMALRAGVRAIQFREKKLSTKRMYEIGKRLRALTRDYDALFFVNDRIDVALAVDADGVHIGQDDMPAFAAREIFPGYIGVSAGNVEEAKKDERFADYLGVGPVFPTKTKEDAGEAIGIEGLRRIVESVSVPVVAIGSINKQNAIEVLKTGVAGIAVISAIAAADDPERAARELVELVRRFKSGL
ncbi:MAG: Thiamine-phosphate synthase [Archaeoglobus fulgidus]|uniref:Thiamine-phosphate synthase n=1 Tax=Archaeoglobus fulgidus TaxID=2234 RepID=A0A124FBV4_ARCFL|nr:thiamine phosphate synthase [Archaeoglobus fulgidus]KUJ93368.1 MAG: Thiamine-phosphate synthase [Archaeoglobus fulgidus]KUK06685.1 MAG: Thiamine-phosphate synthase [Archaeoglobus fulgidus]